MIKQQAICRIIAWYQQAGVSHVWHNSPVVKSGAYQVALPKPTAPALPLINTSAPAPLLPAVIPLVDVADVATLEELHQCWATYAAHPLQASGSRFLPLAGNPQGRLMVISDHPACEDNQQGVLFSSQRGQLLDAMLAAIGYNRTQCSISTIVPWWPPRDRALSDDEIAACLPFVRQQIVLLQPAVILLLGGLAAKAMLGQAGTIMRLRGQWHEHTLPDGRVVPMLASYHPAYLLQSPVHKREAWRDLLAIQQRLCPAGS